MDQYACKRCGKIVTQDENHSCFLLVTESSYRLENESETYEKTIVVTRTSGVDTQKQWVLGASDLINATTDEECKMSLEISKWQTLNKDKKGFMDSITCVIRNALSDSNNISETMNSTVNPDLLPGSNESENGKRQVAEDINDENISLQNHSQGHNKNEKMSTDEKEPISSKEVDNAVAGPSGVCPPKTFSRKDNLKTNYRTVIGDKPFMCNVCEKKFFWKSHHDQHYLTHTGERPFVCDFCEKGFARIYDLNRHVRTHTGDKPFVCYFCKKSFAQKGDLNLHIRTHTGEKPYKCPICGMAFTTSSRCYRHRRNMHK